MSMHIHLLSLWNLGLEWTMDDIYKSLMFLLNEHNPR